MLDLAPVTGETMWRQSIGHDGKILICKVDPSATLIEGI